ncbi:unnamed protein product [Parnassius apollo]|uniref:FXNA-like protease n=1 Tax=Parnassius apollo TaxID=110799 RepID=A0A8S3X8B4_PARAO|nr:unnamed protein product [Parnassius apollo]
MNRKSYVAGLPAIDSDGEREEKSWQKMIQGIRRKGSDCNEPLKPVPSIVILLLLGAYLTLGYLTQLVEDDMPKVIYEEDIQKDDAETFSEESARHYLDQILGTEPRVAGTAYHYEKTKDLKALIDSIAAQANLPVRTDWQFVSEIYDVQNDNYMNTSRKNRLWSQIAQEMRINGDYWLASRTPQVNCYQNLSNIIAVLEGESGFHANGTIGTSLLVNCHYDSVPFAIGASDNGVFCAVMVETLSKLSRRERKLTHNIVFLFNGAEENPLQGSHGFLQHPWSQGITSVVNLDAAGMNGKPSVFQVSDPRIISAYLRSVNRPNAQAFGEFLFKSGIIPSDTDFRIWRDFGDIHGVDIAFAKWGSVYHTRNDQPQLLQPGVVQNAGNMLLGLVANVADYENLGIKEPATSLVYYDYLNLFLLTYSPTVSQIVDVLVALFSFLTVACFLLIIGFRRSSLIDLLVTALGRILALLVGILTVVLLVLLMAATTTQLRYLSKPWLAVPLYWIPFLIATLVTSLIYDSRNFMKSGLNRSLRTLQAMAATRLLLGATLLVLAFWSSLGSLRYVISVTLFIMSAVSLISMNIVRYFRLKAWQHLLLEFVLSLPSTMFLMSMSLRLGAIMLPTAGRIPNNNPDYLVGGISLALAIVVSSTVSGIELLFSRKRLWLPIGLISIVCVVLMFVPMSPYDDDGIATQRHYWFHSKIITYDANKTEVERTSGVLVTRHDAYTLNTVLPALEERGIQLESKTDFAEDCDRYVHCNLPLYRSSFAQYLHDVLFLYTDPPSPFDPEPTLNVTRSCVDSVCTLDCVMIGPAHNTLTFVPRPGVNLTSWSFSSPVQPTSQFANRSVYLVIHSTATYSEKLAPLEFTLTFSVNPTLQTQPIVDISHHAHKIAHPEDFTEEYKKLLDAVPRYFNIASSLSVRSNYIF